MRQDRDEPKVRLPSGGQQFAPELGVELNGGVKAATPGADIDVTSAGVESASIIPLIRTNYQPLLFPM